ncbi:hypothetical protein C8R48DRAFT_675741 [Suillus tomentosus]|nr:hypothetical protein C8R48DRAFT_675741 [Suillus tomentosus]
MTLTSDVPPRTLALVLCVISGISLTGVAVTLFMPLLPQDRDSCHRWGFGSKAISHCESCSLDNRCIFKGYCYVNHYSVVPLLPESVFRSEASFEIYKKDVLLPAINGLEGCCNLTCVHCGLNGIIGHILGKPDAQLMKEALTAGLDDELQALDDPEMVSAIPIAPFFLSAPALNVVLTSGE